MAFASFSSTNLQYSTPEFTLPKTNGFLWVGTKVGERGAGGPLVGEGRRAGVNVEENISSVGYAEILSNGVFLNRDLWDKEMDCSCDESGPLV